MPRHFIVILVCAYLLGGCVSTQRSVRHNHSTDTVYPIIGPYAQIVQVGDMYFLAGVLPLDLAGTTIQGATTAEQTRVVLDHIGAKLKSQGLSHRNVVMATVYLKDLSDFAAMNLVYSEYFPTDPPARATVEVARLPRDARIEIAVIATR